MNVNKQVSAQNLENVLILLAVFNVYAQEALNWTILDVFAQIIMNVPTMPIVNTVVRSAYNYLLLYPLSTIIRSLFITSEFFFV